MQEMLRTLGRKQVAKAHAHLEAMLGDREWLAGDRRTIADAYLTGIARWAAYHDAVDQRGYPELYRLLQKLNADPAVVFANAIEAEKPAVTSGGFRGHISRADLRPRLAA